MVRVAEEYREDTAAIEVSFAAPVNLSAEHQQRLVVLIGEICDAYEEAHPDRVMWPFGIGQKMLCHPMMLSDDAPIPFDDSVFSIECAERENYDFKPASADRNPEGQDAQRLDRNDESAVGAAETPMPKPPEHFRSGGGNASSGNPPPSNQ